MRVVSASGETLIRCHKCSGYSRYRLGHKFVNRCRPESKSNKEYGRMKKRIDVLEEGIVSRKSGVQGHEGWALECIVARTWFPRPPHDVFLPARRCSSSPVRRRAVVGRRSQAIGWLAAVSSCRLERTKSGSLIKKHGAFSSCPLVHLSSSHSGPH